MNSAMMFARAGRVVICRPCETGGESVLVLIGDDRDVRSYCFSDRAGLAQFQDRLKQFLFETGWSLIPLSVLPEREAFVPRQPAPANGWRGLDPPIPIN